MNNISLKSFLEPFPHVFVANEEADNKAILNFYHQSPMNSQKSQIQYLRGDNFFSFLRERSSQFLVLLLKDDNGDIQGIGVLSFRPGYIDQELVTVGYLGDLRVKLNRKLIREYRSMYTALIEAAPYMEETFFCKHFQTVLIDENLESQNNLSANRIPHLVYQKLKSYQMINIWGQIKRPRLTRNAFNIREANTKYHEQISLFLSNHSLHESFHHQWSSELPHRLKEWSDFNYKNILLVFKDNDLLALTMLWNPIKTKQVHISHVSPLIRIAHKLLQCLPIFEVKSLPKPGIPIDILYLHQFIFHRELAKESKKSIVHELTRFCFQYNFDLLAYADFEDENFLLQTPHFFKKSLPMAIYSVHHQTSSKEISFPINKSNESPGFDMSLV